MARVEPVILIVDDQSENLEILFEVFQNTEFDVMFVGDGASCLNVARSDRPDLILLDVMMPDIDGFEVCRQLKASDATQGIPIIFMTALSDTVNKITGFQLGAVDYITKPFQPEEALARVNAHLTLQQLRRELQEKNAALEEGIQRERSLNQELQDALAREKAFNQVQSRFISIASHELRSPLALISMTAKMLKRYPNRMTEESIVKQLDSIDESVDAMTELLNDVLLLVKIESQQFQYHPVSMDMVPFCRDIVAQFSMMSDGIHHLAFSASAEAMSASADSKLLRHIFSNLLSNAIKYSPQGGEITFELLGEPTGDIRIRVCDQGIGISAEDQAHLFDAFHRGENTKQIKGTGLGLWIVRQFVDLHGGAIAVESALQRGTTFTITLPAQTKDSAS